MPILISIDKLLASLRSGDTPIPEFYTLVLLVNVKALFEHSEDPVHGNRCAFGFQCAGFHEQALGLEHRFGSYVIPKRRGDKCNQVAADSRECHI